MRAPTPPRSTGFTTHTYTYNYNYYYAESELTLSQKVVVGLVDEHLDVPQVNTGTACVRFGVSIKESRLVKLAEGVTI